MESILGSIGIASNDTIVVYDDNGLCNSSRLWWILQNYDFDQVRLLHGGIETWKAAGGEVGQVVPRSEAAEFVLSDHPIHEVLLQKGRGAKQLKN